MNKTILALTLLPLLTGCATVIARHPVPANDIPHLSFAQARKNLIASAKKGQLEKSGFTMASMTTGGIAEVREENILISYNKYKGLLSTDTDPVSIACDYADFGNLEVIQYKVGANRYAAFGMEVPLGPRCNNLAMFFSQKEDAEAFARNLLVMKRRYDDGPTKEEQAAARGGMSKEEISSIVQAAVAGAAQAKGGTVSQPPVLITSDVDKPLFSLPEKPDNFAIVVGIGQYLDLPEAQFAERDAEAVKTQLIALGFPSRNVVHLSGEKAGYKSIEKFVETWLPRNTSENSRVVFYFSGHGAPDPQGGKAYLLPYDGDPNFLENTGYPLKRLYQKLEELKAKEVVVVLDSCFSGAGGRSLLAKGARPLVVSVDTQAPASGRLEVFAAASSDQITSTLDEQGHGTFTYYFLKGITGGARGPGGAVTVQGLYDYLTPKVQDAARRQNREQTPSLQGSNGAAELVRF